MEDVVLSVSDFVALLNQTLEYAYPIVVVQGELANFRISKNKWVYFDVKDDDATVRCFGTIYQLPGPLEDGMLVQISAQPRLHPLYNFSLNVQTIAPVGEGSIKKAQALLEAKLQKEGLFALERKRSLPYPPKRIGLIASGQSAAYADFIKILNSRWGGVEVVHAEVQVQGEAAVSQIVSALEYINVHEDVEAIVMTRGGGSAEDLAVFSTEQVARAVAGSRTPTLVAIGHEVDVSLAELAADMRASTPSNAAELLVPNRPDVLAEVASKKTQMAYLLTQPIKIAVQKVTGQQSDLLRAIEDVVAIKKQTIKQGKELLTAFNPQLALKRGYTIARHNQAVINSVKKLHKGDALDLEFTDGSAQTTITSIRKFTSL